MSTGTNGGATVIAAETFDTDGDTVMGGDVTTGAVTGGEREVPGTVEVLVFLGNIQYFRKVHSTNYMKSSYSRKF